MGDWILRALPPFKKYDPSQPVFLRYGLWSRRSYSATKDKYERGVSVYKARVVDGVVELDDYPCPILIGQGRVVFALQGRVADYGSDGEPVLQAVKLIPLPISLEARR